MVSMASDLAASHQVIRPAQSQSSANELSLGNAEAKSGVCGLVKCLLIMVLFGNLGGPFDLMSRRMMSANNDVIAKRIIQEIEIFPAVRDDAQPQKK